jgi:hypothetical protein
MARAGLAAPSPTQAPERGHEMVGALEAAEPSPLAGPDVDVVPLSPAGALDLVAPSAGAAGGR